MDKDKLIEMAKERIVIAASLLYHAGADLPGATKYFKKALLARALVEKNGNQCRAARAVGVHRNTVARIMAAETALDGPNEVTAKKRTVPDSQPARLLRA